VLVLQERWRKERKTLKEKLRRGEFKELERRTKGRKYCYDLLLLNYSPPFHLI
jgi:hypothetical protein